MQTDDDYLRLAAAVGVGETGMLDAAQRTELVESLLDVISTDRGPAAIRAAAEIGALLDPAEAPDIVVLLRHPEPLVRHNLTVALVRQLGNSSLSDLLSDRSAVTAEDATDATRALTGDGIDIHRPASAIRMLTALPYLPNLEDWPQAGD